VKKKSYSRAGNLGTKGKTQGHARQKLHPCKKKESLDKLQKAIANEGRRKKKILRKMGRHEPRKGVKR